MKRPGTLPSQAFEYSQGHEAISRGVHKLNADTDLRHAFRRGIEETWAQGDRQLETAMTRGRELMIEATIAKMRLYGCAGRAGAGHPALRESETVGAQR